MESVLGEKFYNQLKPSIVTVLNGQRQTFDLATQIESEVRTFHVSLIPHIENRGEVEGFVASFVDVTERARLANRLKLTMLSVGVGTWDWDVRTGRVDWDDTQYQLYGIQKSDFRDDYQAWKDTLHPDDLPRLLKKLEKVINDPNESYDVEFRVIGNDKQVRHIRSNAHIERDEKGSAIRMFGINWNVTEQKLNHEKLEAQKMQLVHSNKMAALGELCAGITHEINNPLAIITGQLERVEIDLNEPEKLLSKVRSMRKACSRISAIVLGLRKFFHPSVNLEGVLKLKI